MEEQQENQEEQTNAQTQPQEPQGENNTPQEKSPKEKKLIIGFS